jgi:hypothetical protein
MKYISALDRNQIPSCGFSLDPFKEISIDEVTQDVSIPEGFKTYEDTLYFHDMGVLGSKRFIIGFNPILFAEDRSNRDEKIKFFKSYLKGENNNLKEAKRERKLDATKGRIVNELRRLKIQKYYELPELEPITVYRRLKDGTVKSLKSFKAKVKMKHDVINVDRLLDGVCVFLTNHTEKQGRGFKVKPEVIIKAYRDKTKIEDVFKNVKSFLKLRPFFVNTNAHVKAVYTICILAYFINRYLANKRKATGEKDFLNSNELYAPFKDIDIATLTDRNTGHSTQKAVDLPPSTMDLLERIGMSHIARPQ